MTHEEIAYIKRKMQDHLSSNQMTQLHTVLTSCAHADEEQSDVDHVQLFLAAKRVEGCSANTLKYYGATLRIVLAALEKPVFHITTDDLRLYMDQYSHDKNVTKITLDNIRRILSSFFTWLENEDYIMKSPMRRIHKIKTRKTVKETYSDEELEILRDSVKNLRDRALVEFLCSTGVRVGEVVQLNRDDIDFINRECIVLGKGNKQRRVYFDARVKVHLQKYLDSRDDDNPALFVSRQKPHRRLQIRGMEIFLHNLGQKLNLCRVHPHKFRRTLATMAIDKGMPIEQVQQILGHQNVDTTLLYAQVNQENVKLSHKKFLG